MRARFFLISVMIIFTKVSLQGLCFIETMMHWDDGWSYERFHKKGYESLDSLVHLPLIPLNSQMVYRHCVPRSLDYRLVADKLLQMPQNIGYEWLENFPDECTGLGIFSYKNKNYLILGTRFTQRVIQYIISLDYDKTSYIYPPAVMIYDSFRDAQYYEQLGFESRTWFEIVEIDESLKIRTFNVSSSPPHSIPLIVESYFDLSPDLTLILSIP